MINITRMIDEISPDLEGTLERYRKAESKIDAVNERIKRNSSDSAFLDKQTAYDDIQAISAFLMQERALVLRLLEAYNAATTKLFREKVIATIIGASVGMGFVIFVYSYLMSNYSLGIHKVNTMSYVGGVALGFVYVFYDIRKTAKKWGGAIRLMNQVIELNSKLEAKFNDTLSHLDQAVKEVK